MAARRLTRRLISLSLAGSLLAGGALWRDAAASSTAEPAGGAAASGPVRIMPLGDSITLGITPEQSYRGHLQALLRTAGYEFDFVGSYGNVVPPGGEAVWAWPEASQSDYRGPLDIDFEGHGGFQAGQPQSVVGYPDHMLAQMIPTDIPLFEPDVVLVHIGTNDYLGGWTQHGPWQAPDGSQGAEHAARNVIDLIDSICALRPQAVVLVAPIGKAGLNGVQDDLARTSAIVRAAVDERARAGRPVQFVADLYAGFTPADLADIVHPTDAGYAKMADAWFRALTPVLAARRAATAAPSTCAPLAPPASTTAAPVSTTVAPVPATVASVSTTAAPISTTAASVPTTVAPVSTAPESTATAASSTTAG